VQPLIHARQGLIEVSQVVFNQQTVQIVQLVITVVLIQSLQLNALKVTIVRMEYQSQLNVQRLLMELIQISDLQQIVLYVLKVDIALKQVLQSQMDFVILDTIAVKEVLPLLLLQEECSMMHQVREYCKLVVFAQQEVIVNKVLNTQQDVLQVLSV
jgi:hypothetical protein